MATTTSTITTCDLCRYGDSYSRPETFERHDGFDLCKWCRDEPRWQRIESGGHAVEIGDGLWSCSCGMTGAMLKLTLWRYGVSHEVMAAVPDLPTATANIHVQTPNWPRTY